MGFLVFYATGGGFIDLLGRRIVVMHMTDRDILAQLFSYGWPTPEQLVQFANERHGYMGDDGYYGATYPSDLDEYQIEVERDFIPEGFVEISYWDGAHKETTIKEQKYLEALKAHLLSKGYYKLALVLRNA